MTTVITKPDRRRKLRFMNNISKETFDKADVATQRRILFDLQKATYDVICKQTKACDNRFGAIEGGQKSWKIKTGGIAAVSGFFGGALVMLSKLIFWK